VWIDVHTPWLGAGQYVMYVQCIARGIAAPEWLDRVAGFYFLAHTTGRDVEGYPRCPRLPSLGVGTCHVLEGSLYGEVLGGPVHRQMGRFVGECTPFLFQEGAPSIGDGVVTHVGEVIFFPEGLLVGMVIGSQHRSKVFEGVDTVLR